MDRVNVTDMFIAQAERNPNRCAIVKDNYRISFGELANEVKSTAAYFQSMGIQKGDRVLVFVPMSIDLYRTVLALFDIGATVVFLDEWVSRERLNLCCKIAKCKAWIGGWKVHVLSFLSKEMRAVPMKLGVGFKRELQYTKVQTVGDDVALITFTTGSTGIPKAAIRTHAQLQNQFNALIKEIEPIEGEVDMPVLPIVLLINLGAGCTSVIVPFKAKKADKMNPQAMVEVIQREKVNRIVSSPYFAIRVAEYCAKNSVKLPSLNKVFTGGAPVFPEDAAILYDGFKNANVKVVYGSTEAEPISSIGAADLRFCNLDLEKGLLVGTIHEATQLAILPITPDSIKVESQIEFSKFALRKGEIGEICVSGGHVLNSYLDNPEAIAQNKIFVDGICWHRTGDSGFLNDEGKLYLTGRASNLFTKNQIIYSPFIIENQLKLMDEVRFGTVLEINNKVILFYEGLNSESVLNELRNKFNFVNEIVNCLIPKDPRHFSKIDYGKLKENYLRK